MITRLSHSMLSLWDRCPKAFECRYILKLPEVQSGRMIAGSAYHRGIQYAIGSKINGFSVTPGEVGEVIIKAWEGLTRQEVVDDRDGGSAVEIKEIDWKNDNQNILRSTVIALAKIYLKERLPHIEPVKVEKRYEKMITDNILFVGRVDAELRNGNIIDHKLTKKRMSDNDLENDMQASAYSTLLDRPLLCHFHLGLDQKELKVQVQSTFRGEEDIKWYIDKATKTWHLIHTGIFPPNTSSWLCSVDYCSHWSACRIFGTV